MKDVLKNVYEGEDNLATGVFSKISASDWRAIVDKDKEMIFTVLKLGTHPKKAFGKLSVQTVLSVVGPDVRPIPVQMTLEESIKPATESSVMPTNLFG